MFKLHVSLMVGTTIVLLALISYHQTCGAALVADIQGVPYQVKRSFCNTYGGCSSSKRSMQQQQQAASNTFGTPGSSADRESTSVEFTKKDSSADRVAEILRDLIEYLQTDERYRQRKYVVLVPKQVSSAQRETNSPGEMHELQFGREYIKQDD